jgi:hypothetical protein
MKKEIKNAFESVEICGNCKNWKGIGLNLGKCTIKATKNTRSILTSRAESCTEIL